jgi:hypothetical protein
LIDMQLAKFEPLPPLDQCLTTSRCDEIHRGSGFSTEEERHLLECDWCWATVWCGTDACLDLWQRIGLSLGREPTPEEAEHLRICPGCAYDYTALTNTRPSA